jgi:hypothetical protein
MSDQSINDHIEALVAEEQKLEASETRDAADEATLAADRERLAEIKLDLDRSWDLLRRRRALRDAGANPDDAQERDTHTVEGYLQ